jgi:hypothetical protein
MTFYEDEEGNATPEENYPDPDNEVNEEPLDSEEPPLEAYRDI